MVDYMQFYDPSPSVTAEVRRGNKKEEKDRKKETRNHMIKI